MGQQKLRPSQGRTRPCSCLISIIAQFHEYGCSVGSLMKRNRNGFKILLKERSCSLSNYTKGALLYGVIPVCALCETEHPGHLNVRAVLRHFVPNKGLHPLRRYAAILADLVSRNGFANRSRRPSFHIVSLTVSKFWRSFYIQIFRRSFKNVKTENPIRIGSRTCRL